MGRAAAARPPARGARGRASAWCTSTSRSPTTSPCSRTSSSAPARSGALGLGDGARARIRDLARRFGLEVDPAARVADLTVGERQRVEILKALYRDARILILDEPTAVLTPQETEALFRTLRLAVAEGLSIVFICHKLREVMAVSDRVLVLRHGRLVGERRDRATPTATSSPA